VKSNWQTVKRNFHINETIPYLENQYKMTWTEVRRIIIAYNIKGVLVSKLAEELELSVQHLHKLLYADNRGTKAIPLLFSTAAELKKRNEEKTKTVVDYIDTVR